MSPVFVWTIDKPHRLFWNDKVSADAYPCSGWLPSRCTQGLYRLYKTIFTFEQIFRKKRKDKAKALLHFTGNVFAKWAIVESHDFLRGLVGTKHYFHGVEEIHYIFLSVFLIYSDHITKLFASLYSFQYFLIKSLSLFISLLVRSLPLTQTGDSSGKQFNYFFRSRAQQRYEFCTQPTSDSFFEPLCKGDDSGSEDEAYPFFNIRVDPL